MLDYVHLEAVLHGGGEVREERDGAGSYVNLDRKNKYLHKRTALIRQNKKKNIDGQ